MNNAIDFESIRDGLLGLAYRLLGSRTDAEDVVQEAWLVTTAPRPRSSPGDARVYMLKAPLKSARALPRRTVHHNEIAITNASNGLAFRCRSSPRRGQQRAVLMHQSSRVEN
jgi:hypothetical protein